MNVHEVTMILDTSKATSSVERIMYRIVGLSYEEAIATAQQWAGSAYKLHYVIAGPKPDLSK